MFLVYFGCRVGLARAQCLVLVDVRWHHGILTAGIVFL